jgi:hypothetical protein
MSDLWKYIQSLESPLSMNQIIVDLGYSIIVSIVIYLLYQMFYGSRHIGAGVHRTFIIGGPAITALFLGIQVSIPLSLGLLGALSFVRFRTPVKDPAEIGFLLLLIASSIGAATNNFLITTILIVFVFVALVIHWMFRNRLSVFARGQLMLSIDQGAYADLETKISAFLDENLTGLKLVTMSVVEDRVSLNYQYHKRAKFDWAAFTSELNKVTGEAKVEMFIG